MICLGFSWIIHVFQLFVPSVIHLLIYGLVYCLIKCVVIIQSFQYKVIVVINVILFNLFTGLQEAVQVSQVKWLEYNKFNFSRKLITGM